MMALPADFLPKGVLGTADPHPPGLGTVPLIFPLRAGTTPKRVQSNALKCWVVRVVGVVRLVDRTERAARKRGHSDGE